MVHLTRTIPALSRMRNATYVVASVCVALSAYAGLTEITLKEAGGDKVFQLSQAKGDFVALHFLLKTDCPNCLKHVRSYSEKAKTLSGVQNVFIKPDADEAIVAWAASLKSDGASAPIIYRDPDAKLADELGIPKGYEFHGETVHFPALLVFDPDGKEVFRYIGKDTLDRYSFDAFVTKLAELRHARAVASYNLDKSKVAIQGYDPVTYFDGNTPMQGSKDFNAPYAGAVYYFVSAANRDKFLANPDKYLPAYGGWCATAMAYGKKVEVDPENYKITNGRLFLFYKSLIQNAINDWNKHEPQSTVDADKHWKEISGEGQ